MLRVETTTTPVFPFSSSRSHASNQPGLAGGLRIQDNGDWPVLHPLGAGGQQRSGSGAAAGGRGAGDRGAARVLPGLRGAAGAGPALPQRAPQHRRGVAPAAPRHPPRSMGMLWLGAGERQPPKSGWGQPGLSRCCLRDGAGGPRAGSQWDAGDAARGGGCPGGVLPRAVPAAGAAAAAARGWDTGPHPQR